MLAFALTMSSAGLSRVRGTVCGRGQYYEPANGALRVRPRHKQSLAVRHMEAGHGGKSGRFEKYRSVAEYYAFMLGQLGVSN